MIRPLNRYPWLEGLVGAPTRKAGREYGPTPTEFPDWEYARSTHATPSRPKRSVPTGNDRLGTPSRCGPKGQEEQIGETRPSPDPEGAASVSPDFEGTEVNRDTKVRTLPRPLHVLGGAVLSYQAYTMWYRLATVL